MKPLTKRLTLILIGCALLSGCNTARGIGEDVQTLGHIISHAAS
ncbi:entericidin A/B family lipoprotein [Kosakonia sp. H02]|nr:entericidin A/B family lipoprotein [Kosakonia sp. H02]